MMITILIFGGAVAVTTIWLLSRFIFISRFTQPSKLKGNSIHNTNQMALADGVEYVDGFELGPVTPVYADHHENYRSASVNIEDRNGFNEMNRKSEASNPGTESSYVEDLELPNDESELAWQQDAELDWNRESEPDWQEPFEQILPQEFEQVLEQELVYDLQEEAERDWRQKPEQILEPEGKPVAHEVSSEQRDESDAADSTNRQRDAQEKKSSPMAKIYEFADSFNFGKKTRDSSSRKIRTPMLRPVSVISEAVTLPKPGSELVAMEAPETDGKFSPQTEFDLILDAPDYLENVNREVDVIGWLPGGEQLVASHRVLKAIKKLNIEPRAPLIIQGFDVADERWCDPRDCSAKVQFADLVLSIPLFYLGEPVSERDWWLFSTMVEDLASALGRIHCISETTDTIFDHARDLHGKVMELDLQVVLLLKSDDSGYISEQAMNYLAREFQLQMQQDLPIYDMIESSDGEEHVLFSVVPFNESTHALALELGLDPDSKTVVVLSNLSASVNPRWTFDKMIDLAQSMADRLSLNLVDLNDQEISFKSIRYIRFVIDKVVVEMSELGIEPGSESSVRMFGHNHYLEEVLGIQED